MEEELMDLAEANVPVRRFVTFACPTLNKKFEMELKTDEDKEFLKKLIEDHEDEDILIQETFLVSDGKKYLDASYYG